MVKDVGGVSCLLRLIPGVCMVGIHHQLDQERVDAIKGLRHAVDYQLGSSVGAGLRTFQDNLIVDLQETVASEAIESASPGQCS